MPKLLHSLNLPLQLWEVNEPLAFFADQLPAHVRTQLSAKWHPARQLQFAATRYLLYQQIDPAIKMAMHEKGAPILLNTPLRVSFSHSSHYVGMILSERPVGIDLEQPGSDRNWATSRIFMNAPEAEHYQRHQSPEAFLDVWCAKEVLYKLLNREYEEISFKRQLWTEPGEALLYPRRIRAGFQRDAVNLAYELHLDRPVKDLIVAAYEG